MMLPLPGRMANGAIGVCRNATTRRPGVLYGLGRQGRTGTGQKHTIGVWRVPNCQKSTSHTCTNTHSH